MCYRTIKGVGLFLENSPKEIWTIKSIEQKGKPTEVMIVSTPDS